MDKLLAVVIGIGVFSGVMAVITLIFQALWQYVCVSAFGWPELTFWQSFAIILLLGFVNRGFTYVRGGSHD